MLVSMFCVIAFTCHIFGSSPVSQSVVLLAALGAE